MQEKEFTLFWLTGQSEVVKGENIARAFSNAGYGNEAIQALDFYENGNKIKNYYWDSIDKQWIPENS